MIEQHAWITSHASTLTSVMVEVECGTQVFYSTEKQARRSAGDGEKVYMVTIEVQEMPGE